MTTESFERIHRSNLIGMGVLPLQFEGGVTWQSLGLKGDENVDITGLGALAPKQVIDVTVTAGDGKAQSFKARLRIDTLNELEYFRHGGLLSYVLRNLAA